MASTRGPRCHRTSRRRCSGATARCGVALGVLCSTGPTRDVAHAVHAGETVDGSDFDATVWPRLAAIGERLWSSVDDVDAARPRLEAFRCLLLERGVGAAPLNPDRPTRVRCCRARWGASRACLAARPGARLPATGAAPPRRR